MAAVIPTLVSVLFYFLLFLPLTLSIMIEGGYLEPSQNTTWGRSGHLSSYYLESISISLF